MEIQEQTYRQMNCPEWASLLVFNVYRAIYLTYGWEGVAFFIVVPTAISMFTLGLIPLLWVGIAPLVWLFGLIVNLAFLLVSVDITHRVYGCRTMLIAMAMWFSPLGLVLAAWFSPL